MDETYRSPNLRSLRHPRPLPFGFALGVMMRMCHIHHSSNFLILTLSTCPSSSSSSSFIIHHSSFIIHHSSFIIHHHHHHHHIHHHSSVNLCKTAMFFLLYWRHFGPWIFFSLLRALVISNLRFDMDTRNLPYSNRVTFCQLQPTMFLYLIL